MVAKAFNVYASAFAGGCQAVAMAFCMVGTAAAGSR